MQSETALGSWGLEVVFEHVHERYCAGWALADVSLTVAAGEVVTIAGPPANGAGALLRLIAARRAPQSGAIRLVGQPALQAVDSELFRARSIARLPEPATLLDGLSVEANLEGPLMAARGGWEERRERVAAALEGFGLRDVARCPVGRLAPERRAGLRLAMALIVRPRLLLVDGPAQEEAAVLGGEALTWPAGAHGGGPTVIIASGEEADGLAVERTIELPYRAVARIEEAPALVAGRP